jgi:hypothetical protein
VEVCAQAKTDEIALFMRSMSNFLVISRYQCVVYTHQLLNVYSCALQLLHRQPLHMLAQALQAKIMLVLLLAGVGIGLHGL